MAGNERLIKVDLPKEDMEDLMELCGMHGIQISELVEGFLGDLIGGKHSHGSDERDCAERWFDRCEFGMYPEETLLRYLIIHGDPEEFIKIVDFLEEAKAEKREQEKYPKDYDDEDRRCIEDSISYFEKKLMDMRSEWEPDYEPDMETEIVKVRNWVEEKRKLG